MNHNSRMLIYLSVMALLLSCVTMGYGLLFFGWGNGKSFDSFESLPVIIIVAGIVIAFINAIATNLIAAELEKIIKKLPTVIRVGLPVAVALATLLLTILIALLSA